MYGRVFYSRRRKRRNTVDLPAADVPLCNGLGFSWSTGYRIHTPPSGSSELSNVRRVYIYLQIRCTVSVVNTVFVILCVQKLFWYYDFDITTGSPHIILDGETRAPSLPLQHPTTES